MDATEAAKYLQLSSEAVAAQEAFLQAIETVCCVNAKTFCNFFVSHDLQSSEVQNKSVDLLLYNFFYNV